MGLLNELMSNARKADIGFGIHKNCVVLSVSNDERKTNDGELVKRNCYTTFGQLNDKKAVVGEKTVSWFNLDNTSEYVYDSFFNQLDQMTCIMNVFHPEGKKDPWEDAFLAILEEEEIETGRNETELEANLREALADKATCKSLMKSIGDAYVELLENKVGAKSQPIRLKIVYDKNGKYLQQPKFEGFVESMEISDEDSRLKITNTENQYKAKSLTQNTNTSKPGKL